METKLLDYQPLFRLTSSGDEVYVYRVGRDGSPAECSSEGLRRLLGREAPYDGVEQQRG